MADKKRGGGGTRDKERILNYLFRKGNLCNTYKVARELGMERWDVLEGLQELATEGKVNLMHGSVKAVTKELSEEDKVRTKSEVDELKERVEKLEKVLKFTFGQLMESIQMGYGKISTKGQSKENEDNLENKQ